MTLQVYSELLDRIQDKEQMALVTVMNSQSKPGLNGQKLLIDSDGQVRMDFVADSLEDKELNEIVDSATAALQMGEIRQLSTSSLELLVEPFVPNSRLIIFGGGNVGEALYKFVKELDFEVVIVDDRASFANRKRFPEAEDVICTGFEDISTTLNVQESDYIVIATRGHKHDYDCLKQIINIPVHYIGMLGSQRRVIGIFDRLRNAGVAEEKIKQVHAPIGIDISSETPGEIAISILAEIIKVHRTQKQVNNVVGEEALRFLADYDEDYEQLALATIINTSGSTPRHAGSKMVILPDGRTCGTIGGGCSEAEVRQKALEVIQGRLKPYVHTLDLSNDLAAEEGMVCGGRMEVYIESITVRDD
ncbi:MAG: XdhC family protein [Bacillota bacterium]